jgi:O-antigen/teichoic acid export membrane protein
LISDEIPYVALPVESQAGRLNRWLRFVRLALPATATLKLVAISLADQALAVGGGVLANVVLARTQSRREYGLFALSYSVFSFLLGLYYAAILEPCTVYGSGRYRERFPEYLRLMVRVNALWCALLTGTLVLVYWLLSWAAPQLMSRALLGLALTAGVLLSGGLLRRLFYIQREPLLAAQSSLVFLVTVMGVLWWLARVHRIDSLTVFLALALGWIAAGAVFGRRLRFGAPTQSFLRTEPHYWREHWKYAKWVLATAFVLQFMQQGYYWLLAWLRSSTEVANLRAMYLLVAPLEQIFIALSYLVVPALAVDYAAKRMNHFFSLWKRYALATAGLSIAYILLVRTLGSSAVHMLYNGKYDGLAPYLLLLALVPMVIWIGTTMGHALNAVERPQFQFWAYASSAVMTSLLGIPLIIHFGLWGAVYGMLLSSATYTVALAISFLLTFRKVWPGELDLACNHH